VRDFVEITRSPLRRLEGSVDLVALDEALADRRPAAIWAACYAADEVNEDCLEYLRHWRHVKPFLSGNDLLALGVSPGRPVGDMLRTLRTARLRGLTQTRDDEIALARREMDPTRG
jgi:tRNA nucleotidyltransferase (CCA-adding enzyme)